MYYWFTFCRTWKVPIGLSKGYFYALNKYVVPSKTCDNDGKWPIYDLQLARESVALSSRWQEYAFQIAANVCKAGLPMCCLWIPMQCQYKFRDRLEASSDVTFVLTCAGCFRRLPLTYSVSQYFQAQWRCESTVATQKCYTLCVSLLPLFAKIQFPPTVSCGVLAKSATALAYLKRKSLTLFPVYQGAFYHIDGDVSFERHLYSAALLNKWQLRIFRIAKSKRNEGARAPLSFGSAAHFVSKCLCLIIATVCNRTRLPPICSYGVLTKSATNLAFRKRNSLTLSSIALKGHSSYRPWNV